MFRLTRPSFASIAAILASQQNAPFTYPDVGATRAATPRTGYPPAGYTIDRRRILLGTGADTFARAVAALRAWRMTSLGWAAIHPPAAPIAPGTVVAMVVRHHGLWSMHACRIVYTVDEEQDDVRRVAFAYGTLPAHAAIGEERFAVEWDRADDRVWYDLAAFSRPAHPLMRLARPLARRLQRRFGHDSARAMREAVDGTPPAHDRVAHHRGRDG